MKELLVGTGGWAYFQIPSKPALKAYSEVFSFVEVNNTFYEYPSMPTVENWRRSVPSDFVFSVRCHRELTHNVGLKPADSAFDVFFKMKAYCRVLETPYLVLETPVTRAFSQGDAEAARDFFSSVSTNGLQLVWEYRAPLTNQVSSLMEDLNIVQSVDLSIRKPQLLSDLVYSRLFGKGKHNIYQFSDSELLEIERRAEETGASKVILAYHGQRMHSDALRFKRHQATGKFPPVTEYVGLDSVKAVLLEDARFPINKAGLIEDQGWKVFDLNKDQRVHLSEVLDKIPEKTYRNLEEIVVEVKGIL